METKELKTLIPDIKKVFEEPHTFEEKNVQSFANSLARLVADRINPSRGKPSLRMSNLGSKCDRKLWYSINTPERLEKLPFATRIKFLYGDILEQLLLFLAKEAGHKVEGEQDELSISGVVGHRDAVIDGVTVDVKSASTYSFKSFSNHLSRSEDKFGYIDQLGAYLYAGKADDLVSEKHKAAFLVVDKTLGHICLDEHEETGINYDQLVENKKKMLAGPLPPRGFSDEPMGKSGNRKLCTECSYCPSKHDCWPSLRTFIYSYGPEHLTKVEKLPNVPEATGKEKAMETE